jgi:hypothetical protein
VWNLFDGESTTDASLQVQGIVAPEATVTVNGQPLAAKRVRCCLLLWEWGTTEALYPGGVPEIYDAPAESSLHLDRGVNTLTFAAQFADGTVVERDLTITFDPTLRRVSAGLVMLLPGDRESDAPYQLIATRDDGSIAVYPLAEDASVKLLATRPDFSFSSQYFGYSPASFQRLVWSILDGECDPCADVQKHELGLADGCPDWCPWDCWGSGWHGLGLDLLINNAGEIQQATQPIPYG